MSTVKRLCTFEYIFSTFDKLTTELGLSHTVNFIVLGQLHRFWDSGYFCHFSTEMA